MTAKLRGTVVRLWLGDYPPLTAFASALLLYVAALVAIEILTSLALSAVDDLKAIILIDGIGVIAKLAFGFGAVAGVLRSIWKATGRPNLWFCAALVVAVAGAAALSIPKLLRLRETGLMLVDRDPVGEPAKISVRNGEVIFNGSITYGAAERFRTAADKAGRQARLRITSGGGRQFEAEKIANEVARRKMAVYVPESCESACTSILIASPDRYADVHASIGFHQATRDGASAAESLLLSENMRGDMRAAGIDEDFIEKSLEKPADDMWYPTPDELLKAKIVDRLDSQGTLKAHVKWLADGELPWLMDDWVIVGAKSQGRRLDLRFGFIPGSKLWKNPPSAAKRRELFAAYYCKDEYYRPLLDQEAVIALADVAGGSITQISRADCGKA